MLPLFPVPSPNCCSIDAALCQARWNSPGTPPSGGALQRATAVHLEDGELLVDAVSPQWAREVSRSRPMILTRLQMLLGDKVVKRITIRTK